MVIALLELGLPRERFEVVAVDISERSIRRAAAGLYSSNAFRGMEPRLQVEYFLGHQGRYLLKPRSGRPSGSSRGTSSTRLCWPTSRGFDVVFCRNLLIYFDDAARARAFANLDRLTAVEGLLFLGHADRPDAATGTRFAQYADNGSFVYRKQAPAAAGRPPAGPCAEPARPERRCRADPCRRRLRRRDHRWCRSLAPHRPPAGPGPRRRARSTPRRTLAEASALADRGRYAEAIALVEQRVTPGSLDAPAHFLLGIITRRRATGSRPRPS